MAQEADMLDGFYTKKMDEMGRVVIPHELRKRLDWEPNDTIAMHYVDENTAIMQRKEVGQRTVVLTGPKTDSDAAS